MRRQAHHEFVAQFAPTPLNCLFELPIRRNHEFHENLDAAICMAFEPRISFCILKNQVRKVGGNRRQPVRVFGSIFRRTRAVSDVPDLGFGKLPADHIVRADDRSELSERHWR